MAIVVTYSAPDLTVTGGTEGTPARPRHVYDEDVSQGWGVVTEVIRDKLYIFAANLNMGDVSTPTYFAETHCILIMDDIFRLETTVNSVFKMGTKDGNYAGYNGGMIAWRHQSGDTMAGFDLQWDGTVLLYGVKICDLSDTETYQNADIDVNGASSEFINIAVENIARMTILNDAYIYGWRAYKCSAGMSVAAPVASPTIDNVEIRKCSRGLQIGDAQSNITFGNIKIYNSIDYDLYITGGRVVNGWMRLVNCEFTTVREPGPDHPYWDGSIFIAYKFNLHVADKDGNNLASVTCLLEDKDGNTIFSVSTAADGTITEQVADNEEYIAYQKVHNTLSPFKLTMSKAGKETLIKDNITIDELKDLEYELLPALAVGDVRFDTDFGEDKTGTLSSASHIFGGVILR